MFRGVFSAEDGKHFVMFKLVQMTIVHILYILLQGMYGLMCLHVS